VLCYRLLEKILGNGISRGSLVQSVVEHATAHGVDREEPGIARQAKANTLATDAILLGGELEDRRRGRQKVVLRT
jgi:hypothetical protein